MEEKNVLGTVLRPCCHRPKTGFYRDGFCSYVKEDSGEHTVCIIASEEFLKYSKEQGNDLSTPKHQFGFEGVQPGQPWCLCALRWIEAFRAGAAPKIVLESTHEMLLDYVSIDILKQFATKSHDAKKGLIYTLSSQ
ncbi:DUF2237 family protein [Sulfurospirillum arcachonense]|uniref:DUF2237 family protein n=1 Tax=Sulfurospirillum arcachonense TaxID=57666 RepID=UPI0004AC7B2F|nr:DUF2237 domain-containing protein [Sulfurospirillum arcachonense]